jgi:hypothetical protein
VGRLSSLSPLKQLAELGKIEASLRPFGSSESSSKAGDKPTNGADTKTAPSTDDTGFNPSRARSDAPVITPLNGGKQQVDINPKDMDVKQMIQEFQKVNKVNLSARKRH